MWKTTASQPASQPASQLLPPQWCNVNLSGGDGCLETCVDEGCTTRIRAVADLLPSAMAQAKCGLQSAVTASIEPLSALTDSEEALLRGLMKVLGATGKKAVEQCSGTGPLVAAITVAMDEKVAADKKVVEQKAREQQAADDERAAAQQALDRAVEDGKDVGQEARVQQDASGDLAAATQTAMEAAAKTGAACEEGAKAVAADAAVEKGQDPSGKWFGPGARVQLSVTKDKETWSHVRFTNSKGELVTAVMDGGPKKGERKIVMSKQVEVIDPVDASAPEGTPASASSEPPCKKTKMDVALQAFGAGSDDE